VASRFEYPTAVAPIRIHGFNIHQSNTRSCRNYDTRVECQSIEPRVATRQFLAGEPSSCELPRLRFRTKPSRGIMRPGVRQRQKYIRLRYFTFTRSPESFMTRVDVRPPGFFLCTLQFRGKLSSRLQTLLRTSRQPPFIALSLSLSLSVSLSPSLLALS